MFDRNEEYVVRNASRAYSSKRAQRYYKNKAVVSRRGGFLNEKLEGYLHQDVSEEWISTGRA